MSNQAEAFGCSVAYISAVEIGNKAIPSDYADRFARWLGLGAADTRRLKEAADASVNVVRLRPRDPSQAKLASQLARELGRLTPDQIRRLRSVLDEEIEQ